MNHSQILEIMSGIVDTKTFLRVTNIDGEITREMLYSAFITFGDIVDVIIPPVDDEQDRHAFIQFEDAEDCDHAQRNMDASEMLGKVISVTFADASAKITTEQPNKPLWELDPSKSRE